MNHKWIKLGISILLVLSTLTCVSAEENDTTAKNEDHLIENQSDGFSALPSAVPNVSNELSVTDTPAPTDDPVVTDTPVPTDDPVVTYTPDPTDDPVGTYTPDPTDEPVGTYTPDPTDNPVVTTTPTVETEWNIKTADELMQLADVILQATELEVMPDFTVTLSSNIEVDDEFVGLGTPENPFQGTFDGDEFTITLKDQPLFQSIGAKQDGSVSEIKDININGYHKTFEDTATSIGILANEVSQASISNCHVVEGCIENTFQSMAASLDAGYDFNRVGGLVGSIDGDNVTMDNVSSAATIINGLGCKSFSGGVVGYINGTSTILEDALFTGSITHGSDIGGIIGYTAAYFNLKNSSNQGTIKGATQYGSGDGFGGGIIGYASYDGSISNCYNSGSIINNLRSGGIAGGGSYLGIDKSINAGTIDATSISGGIAGILQSSSTLYSSMNTGDVYADNTNGYAGGIVGTLTSSELARCYSIANEIQANKKYGLVGKSEGTNQVNNNLYHDPEASLGNQYDGMSSIASLINRNSLAINKLDADSNWMVSYGILPRIKDFFYPSLAYALSVPKEIVGDEYQLTYIDSIDEYKVNGDMISANVIDASTVLTYQYGENEEVVLPIPNSAIGKTITAHKNTYQYGLSEDTIDLPYDTMYDSNSSKDLDGLLQVTQNDEVYEINELPIVTYEIVSSELEGVMITESGNDLDFSNVQGENNKVGEYNIVINMIDRDSLATYQDNIKVVITPYILNQSDVSLKKTSMTYIGSEVDVTMNVPQSMDYSLGYNTDDFILDTDYTLEYSDNVNVGNATVVFKVVDTDNIILQNELEENVDSFEYTFKILPFNLLNYPEYMGETIITNIKEAVTYTYDVENPQKDIYALLEGVSDISIFNDIEVLQTYAANTEVGSGGKATVVIQPKEGNTNVTGQLTYEYDIIARSLDETCFEITGDTGLIYDGDAQTVNITPLLVAEDQYTTSYSQNINVGEASLLISANSPYTTGSYSHTFTIGEKEITKEDFVVDTKDVVYTGDVFKPSVTSDLTSDDYDVVYPENTEIDTHSIVIKGKGNYSGELSYTFDIVPYMINKDDFVIDSAFEAPNGVYKNANIKYTGESIDFAQYLTTELPSADYEISYDELGNTNAGVVTMMITGKNHATGSFNLKFYINVKSIELSDFTITEIVEQIGEFEYSGQPHYFHITDTTLKDEDYTVRYSNYDHEAESDEPIEIGKYNHIIEGRGNYGGTLTSALTVVPINLEASDFEFDLEDVVYTGDVINKDVVLNNEVMTEDDYEVTFENNINVGNAKVIVTGKNHAEDTVTKEFEIIAKSLSEDDFTVDTTSKAFTGSEIKPTVSSSLLEDDYQVVYKNNVICGTATIEITGHGNYDDTLTYTFEITEKELSREDFTVSESLSKKYVDDLWAYTSEGIIYSGDVIDFSEYVSSELDEDDYIISYDDNINAGVVTMKITGVNNTTGELELYFYIKPKSISDVEIKFIEIEEQHGKIEYTGYPIEINIEGDLVEGEDYVVSYQEDHTSIGDCWIKIECINNYTGDNSRTFKIIPMVLNEDNFDEYYTIDLRDEIYTGEFIEKALKTNTDVLNEDDYTVSYTYENGVNIGSVFMNITGKNHASGSVSKTFDVIQRTLSKEDFTVDTTDENYISDEITKKVTSALEASNYEVSYSNHINVGTATMMITGKNNCTSSVTYTFDIVARKLSVEDFSYDVADIVYTGLPITKTLTSSLLNAEDYLVTYTNNVSLGEVFVSVAPKNNNASGSFDFKFDIQISGSIPSGTTFDLETNKRYSSKDAFNIEEDEVTYQGNINFYVEDDTTITMAGAN